MTYGLPVDDPRSDSNEQTYAWTLNMLTTMPFMAQSGQDMQLAFEIVGIPTHPPQVGDSYQLALVFERTTIDDYQPLVDGVWV